MIFKKKKKKRQDTQGSKGLELTRGMGLGFQDVLLIP
jgi:hypothetical protein